MQDRVDGSKTYLFPAGIALRSPEGAIPNLVPMLKTSCTAETKTAFARLGQQVPPLRWRNRQRSDGDALAARGSLSARSCD